VLEWEIPVNLCHDRVRDAVLAKRAELKRKTLLERKQCNTKMGNGAENRILIQRPLGLVFADAIHFDLHPDEWLIKKEV